MQSKHYWLALFLLPLRTVSEINRVCINFLWNGPDCLTCHALLSWDDITYPYNEAGFGARDLQTLNKACILKLIWNIVSNKEILWVKWINKNIIKDHDFWALNIPSFCMLSWCAILKGRTDALFMARHLIGDGRNTRVWLNLWQHMGLL